jgi:hypothetical protein
MTDKIKIIHDDGINARPEDFSAIIIASLVEPKKQIIDKIRKKELSGKIIIRSAEGLRTLLYDKVQNHELRGLKIMKRAVPSIHTINTSLLISQV